MSATTIKLEAELVEKVSAMKPKSQSISAFVRGLTEREHRARAHRAAAAAYQQFLSEHPEELAALQEWEAAPLVDGDPTP
jgi:predicted CopG family antitoxin